MSSGPLLCDALPGASQWCSVYGLHDNVHLAKVARSAKTLRTARVFSSNNRTAAGVPHETVACGCHCRVTGKRQSLER